MITIIDISHIKIIVLLLFLITIIVTIIDYSILQGLYRISNITVLDYVYHHY